MPIAAPVAIIIGTWCVFDSRMRLRIAGVPSITSQATTRPSPDLVREQDLRDDAFDGHRELQAHLLLLVAREGIDDAVDGLRRIGRVQRREDEVAGLGRGDRGRHRLQIAHLADEDHVRILPQHVAQRVGERARIDADLALLDDAASCCGG